MLSSMKRHFVFQHPLFSRRNGVVPEKQWKTTVYYWWWMYLKREPDYLNTCEKGGVGVCDELYLDFGDVRGDDFKSWWQDGNRGVELFSEPPTGIKRILDSGDKVPPVTVALTVSFPLVFTKDRMEKDFQKILRRLQNHDGTLGQHRYMRSQAKYPVLGTSKNLPTLGRSGRISVIWGHMVRMR